MFLLKISHSLGFTDQSRAQARPLPVRDIFLLPAIALATIVLLGLGAEAVARAIFPEQQRDACQLNSRNGGEFKPNCASEVKLAEGPWLQDRYNDCGFRSAHSCAAEPPGTLRAAVLGTSIARGEWVAYDASFAGRVEADLSRACNRDVDLQNVSIPVSQSADGYLWHLNVDKAERALSLHPQALILVMSPFDLGEYQQMPAGLDAASVAAGESAAPAGVSAPTGRAARLHAAWDWVKNTSRAVLMLQHVMYRDENRYIPMFLKHGDSIDYLRPPFTPVWQMRLRIADLVVQRIADKASAAGVPLIVAFVPQRAQAALSANPAAAKDVDPFALGHALAQSVAAHGATFVDITELTRDVAKQSGLFYPVDTHPTALGHALIARGVERALLAAAPAFEACRPARSAEAAAPPS